MQVGWGGGKRQAATKGDRKHAISGAAKCVLSPGSYTPPTSMTTSRPESTAGSRVRTISAPANWGVWRSRKQPRASSQWKVPLWVPMVAPILRLLPSVVAAAADMR
jgi:hypothetical protein